jgi:hypothetical protein
MDALDNVTEILDFAIEREIESAQFYTNLAVRVENPTMQQVFRDFAREEQGHKAKLTAIKKRLRPDQRIEIDGGMGPDTIRSAREAGADWFVLVMVIISAALIGVVLYFLPPEWSTRMTFSLMSRCAPKKSISSPKPAGGVCMRRPVKCSSAASNSARSICGSETGGTGVPSRS